jgi:lysophospholipase L1-like esterase
MTNFTSIIVSFILLIAATTSSCSKSKINATENMANEKKYLALGDSYTIGEAVPSNQNFPNQLVASLSQEGIKVAAPRIIATTGWTTTNLKNAIASAQPSNDYDLVTLLIGVNNQYQQKPITLYNTEFRELLDAAVSFAKGDKKRVIVVSIPDYGVTPFAQTSDTARIARELDDYNAIAKSITESLNIKFINITPISRSTVNRNQLIAIDGLHPSAFQYSLWVKEILPAARIILQP